MERSIIAALVVLAIATAGCQDDDRSPSGSEVLGTTTCPEARCIQVNEALDTLGWTFQEPNDLPEAFDLYSRLIERDPPAPGTEPRGYEITHEYRFQDSRNVPAILLGQRQLVPGSPIDLRLESDACVPFTDTASGPIYYVEGLIRLLPTPDESTWLVCNDDAAGHPSTHSIVMVRDSILLQIISFPESGVTKEEIVRFAESLAPVGSAAD